MRFSEDDLRAAVAAGALDGERFDGLVAFLKTRATPTPAAAPQFDLAHVLWYAGALIVIGAMGMFSTLAFSQIVWAVAFKWYSLTGGDNGLIAIPVPEALTGPRAFYLFTVACAGPAAVSSSAANGTRRISIAPCSRACKADH